MRIYGKCSKLQSPSSNASRGFGQIQERKAAQRESDEGAGLKWNEALDARVQTRRATVRGSSSCGRSTMPLELEFEAQRGELEALPHQRRSITLLRPRLPLLLLPNIPPTMHSTLHTLHSGPSRAWGSAAHGEHGRLPPRPAAGHICSGCESYIQSARTSPPALSDHQALGPGDFWNSASDHLPTPPLPGRLGPANLHRPRTAAPFPALLLSLWVLASFPITSHAHSVVPHPSVRAVCHISQPITSVVLDGRVQIGRL
jgi:hypothetical protein